MCACALLLLLAALPALAGPRGSAAVAPSFAAQQQTAVLARVGDTVALRCRVLHLADRTVSWVRSSDLQILTHAGYVFTADTRVSCEEAPADPEADEPSDGSGEPTSDRAPRVVSHDGGWHGSAVHTLRIRRLRVSDAGRYECQVNTEPKMSLFFNLTVIESSLPVVAVRALGTAARGAVWGAAGGSAQIACEARYESSRGSQALAPELLAALPSLRVRWMHDGETLDPQSGRGGISLDTERWAGRVVSRLTLAQLGERDAGRYTCAASAAEPGASADKPARADLVLRLRGHGGEEDDITEGEMEAMQRDMAVARVAAGASASVLRGARAACVLLPLLLFLT